MKGPLISIVAAICVLAAARAGPAVDQLHYAPAVVRLAGTLVVEDYYGPPNFGETSDVDWKLKALVLELESPVAVIADPNDPLNTDSFPDVRRVQLANTGRFTLGEKVGQKIGVEGTLYQRFNGWHLTDVLMSIRRLIPN